MGHKDRRQVTKVQRPVASALGVARKPKKPVQTMMSSSDHRRNTSRRTSHL